MHQYKQWVRSALSLQKTCHTCSVTPHPFQPHFSLGLSECLSFSQMHLQYGSKLLFLPGQSPCFKGRCESLLIRIPNWPGLPHSYLPFSLSFLLFPFLSNIYLTLTQFILFFFPCIHSFHSTLLFGPWSWYRCCWEWWAMVRTLSLENLQSDLISKTWMMTASQWDNLSEERVLELRQE